MHVAQVSPLCQWSLRDYATAGVRMHASFNRDYIKTLAALCEPSYPSLAQNYYRDPYVTTVLHS